MSSGKGNSESDTANQTTTNTSTETYTTVDNRAVQGDDARIGGNVGVVGNSGALTISTTDQGAVQAGLDLALESLGVIQNLTTSQQSSNRDTISSAFGLADKARQSETSNAIQSLLKYGAAVVVIALIAWAYTRR
jgi:hypothetical protein